MDILSTRALLFGVDLGAPDFNFWSIPYRPSLQSSVQSTLSGTPCLVVSVWDLVTGTHDQEQTSRGTSSCQLPQATAQYEKARRRYPPKAFKPLAEAPGQVQHSSPSALHSTFWQRHCVRTTSYRHTYVRKVPSHGPCHPSNAENFPLHRNCRTAIRPRMLKTETTQTTTKLCRTSGFFSATCRRIGALIRRI